MSKNEIVEQKGTGEIFTAEELPFPIKLMLDIYNLSTTSENIKKEITLHLNDLATKRNHKASGFRKDENGRLIFDDKLFTESIYKGKIDTYTNVLKNRANKLLKDMEMVQHMGESHSAISMIIDKQLLEQKVCEEISRKAQDQERILKMIPQIFPELKRNAIFINDKKDVKKLNEPK
ncbi:hypothetical protein [Desulfotalea psychrophila]|uniref:Uncharacterized protein n=1 Tax=Desulfotalea psychrophila (strain LSv54 / DSM 12343) TaxID=177439 RepID=Q6AI78_DESPS|nr:hypothetical protein [Desulfotalea psychrophila]CAG37851.1 hypothetical protein DPPA04 [Desulfotalea psychrophila LSv54]